MKKLKADLIEAPAGFVVEAHFPQSWTAYSRAFRDKEAATRNFGAFANSLGLEPDLTDDTDQQP